MKKLLLAAGFIAGIGSASFAQNYVSGIVSMYGDNTASGNTTVANGASFIFNNSKLYAQSGFVNFGDSTAISADSGTLVMNGSASQEITGRFNISALQISNNSMVSLSHAVYPTMVTILDSITFRNVNNGMLDAGDSLLTLRSNATKTARVADLTNNRTNIGNAITGKVVVERYIRSRRSWHLLSPPTTADSVNDQTIQESWQEGVRASRGQIVDPHPGYGTVITRPGKKPPAGTTGYDDGVAGSTSYSMKVYYSNGLLAPPINTDLTHFSSHAAYFLFVRGDRSVGPAVQTSTNHTPSTITTLRTKGALHNGDVIDTVTQTLGGFAGISNPYACTVDFSNVTLNGVTNGFYTWDPSINTIGGWVYIDGDDNYNATPLTPGGVGVYTNPATNALIQSGQGIVVKPIGNMGIVTFKESSKNITNRVETFRQGPVSALNVSLFSKDSSHLFLDGATTLFDASFSRDALPGEDISKPENLNENLSFYATGSYLMKDKYPMPANGDTLHLRLWKTAAKPYTLSFSMKYMEGALPAYLFDKYTQSSTAIQTGSTTNYDFTIASDSGSKAIDRFAIVFGSKVLPVTLTQIRAIWDGSNVNVQWNVHSETDVSVYEVERSTDGVAFTKIGTVAPRAGSSAAYAYSFADGQPADGNNFYRIKVLNQNGSTTYTNIAIVSVPTGKMLIAVYPNPVKDGSIKLWFKNTKAGTYGVQLYTMDGKAILSKSLSHAGSAAMYTIPAGTIAKGIYHAVIRSSDSKRIADVSVMIE